MDEIPRSEQLAQPCVQRDPHRSWSTAAILWRFANACSCSEALFWCCERLCHLLSFFARKLAAWPAGCILLFSRSMLVSSSFPSACCDFFSCCDKRGGVAFSSNWNNHLHSCAMRKSLLTLSLCCGSWKGFACASFVWTVHVISHVPMGAKRRLFVKCEICEHFCSNHICETRNSIQSF